MSPLRAFLLATLISLACPAFAGGLTWEPAPSADDFVGSIGVCTHWSYGDTPYGTEYDAVKSRLAESGIRNVRDGLTKRSLELWKDLGVQTTAISEPQMGSLDKQVAEWDANPGMIAMIEGPNEPNLFWKRFNVRYKGDGWPKGLQHWQNDLYAAVKADAMLAAVPVTSPTPIFEGPMEAAPLTSFDYQAIHPYAGGGMPSTSISWSGQSVRNAMQLLGANTNIKPFVATESGYHNAVGGQKVLAGAQNGISETAGGRYFPRHFAEYWNAGFARTFVYEFIDERDNPADPEANFGLLRHDATPKPAFTAVSNTIALLEDAHWDATGLKWTRPAAQPRAIQLAIDGPDTVHHTVLSKSDGSIELLLWNEVPSYNTKTNRDLNPDPVQVTVRLASPCAAELYRPLAGKAVQQNWKPSAAISLNVPDEVVILRMTPPLPTGSAPAAPTRLHADATARTATLQWSTGDDKPAAYVVSRLGRYLGTVIPTADGGGSYTDADLTPGLGYTYSVSAVGANGLLSTPAITIAHTINQRPDLVIKSVSWTPANPKPGDEVQFTAVIANIGNAATPAVTHGVSFQVNGVMAAWSDTSHEPLAPGATRTLTTNNGPKGKATWTCTDGTFQILAHVDDVNRIDESDKTNNTYMAVLSTGVGPDLVVSGVRADGDAASGQPVNLIGTVRNRGTGATPDGVIISCTFLVTDSTGAKTAAGFGILSRSLAAGESADIPISKPWIPPSAGVYTLVGIADDVNRIAELNKANNTSAPVSITVK